MKNQVNENQNTGIPSAESKATSELKVAPAKPNCYECKHRRELPGDAHSRCANPAVKPEAIDELFAALGVGLPTRATIDAARVLNVKGNPMGIRRGWFMWPYNFDPTWLESCNGFEPKTQATSEQKG